MIFISSKSFFRTKKTIFVLLSLFCGFLRADEPQAVVQVKPSQDHELSFEEIFSQLELFLDDKLRPRLEAKQISKSKGKTLTGKEKRELDKELALIHSGYQSIYKALGTTDKSFEQGEFKLTLGQDSFRHLRLLCGDQGSQDKSIWTKLDRTGTCFGQAVLAKMLLSPTTNLELLKARQSLLKKMLEDQAFFNYLNQSIRAIKRVHRNLIKIFGTDPSVDYENILHKSYGLFWQTPGESEDSRRSLISRLFNKLTLGLFKGKAKYLDQISFSNDFNIVLFGILGRASNFYTTSILMRKNFEEISSKKFRIDILNQITGSNSGSIIKRGHELGASFLTIWYTFVWPFFQTQYFYQSSIDWVNAIKKSLRQFGSMRKLFDNYKKLSAIVNNLDPETQKALNLFQISAEDLEKKINKNLRWLSKNLSKTKTPGGFLKAYKMIYELRAEMGYILASIGQIDAFLSMAKLYKELSAKKKGLCFAQFIDSDVPKIKAQEAWDFSLDACVAVPSNFELGGGDDFHNGILTGPNTAGKSTFMRSAFLNILLAQTFGLGCAHSLELTLFHGLFSYMNVVDNISKGMSQFYSEAHTVTQALNRIKDLAKEGKTSFFMVDEMFSGTNPEDARSILEAICKSICKIDKSVWIVSTHLTGAASAIIEQTKGKFGGLMVNNFVGPDGKVVFDHRIVPGVSTTSTAFDVITDVGLDMEIVDDARIIQKNLVH